MTQLVEAGAIILGKANLSVSQPSKRPYKGRTENLNRQTNKQEMTGWKGFGVTTGWSALGGQTQSPYIVGGFKDGDKLLGHSVGQPNTWTQTCFL